MTLGLPHQGGNKEILYRKCLQGQWKLLEMALLLEAQDCSENQKRISSGSGEPPVLLRPHQRGETNGASHHKEEILS